MKYTDIPEEHKDNPILLEAASEYNKGGLDAAQKVLDAYPDMNWVIDDALSNYIGMVVTNPDTGVGRVVFRGTIPDLLHSSDIFYDIGIATGLEGLHSQHADAKKFMEEATNAYNIDSCVGYSKGGGNCIDWSAKYEIPLVLYNPAFAETQLRHTSIFGSEETSHNAFEHWYSYLNPLNYLQFSPTYQLGTGLYNLTKGGYPETAPITIYRTHSDPVSFGTNLTTSVTHPHLTVHNMDTREGFNAHDLENFYDRLH